MISLGQPTSVWQKTPVKPNFPRLTSDIAVDIAIVGGGITGLSAALLLRRAGLSVAVIEASTIGSGVTGYTTAHLSEAPDTRYQALISDFGEEGAQLAAASRRTAIERIADFVEEENIDCNFQRLPGYLYTESADDVSLLESETEAARQLGVNTTLTSDVPLPFPVRAGILFPEQGQFHALKYLQGLAQALTRSGGLIFEQTRVVDITSDAEGCHVYTELKAIRAEKVILATHVPIHDLMRMPELTVLSTKIVPYRSYVIGVQLKFPPAPQGLFWDTAEPYHYTRSYVGERGEMLLIGGADHKTGEEVDTQECYQRLEEYARSRYNIASIDYRWSSQYYEPVDGLPYIGKGPGDSNLYVATGYSGNGMTFGTVAAMLLTDQILGRKNPWSKLYDANRIKPIASAQDFITQNVDVATHFIADRFKADAHKLSQVALNEGKIVELDGEQVAAYRDKNGQMHAISAVCSHLGCIVNWNEAEKSWDCPCHGGRFSPMGEVLNGPPIHPLAPEA